MAPIADPHPPEELLELYSLERLSEHQRAQIEEHLLICPDCQAAVEDLDAFIAAMRAALCSLSPPDRPAGKHLPLAFLPLCALCALCVIMSA